MFIQKSFLQTQMSQQLPKMGGTTDEEGKTKHLRYTEQLLAFD